SPRNWSFSLWTALTPVVALSGAIGALPRVVSSTWSLHERTDAFVLATGMLGFAFTAAALNLTFVWGVYFAVPLLAVVLAWPSGNLGITPRALQWAFIALLACEGSVRT